MEYYTNRFQINFLNNLKAIFPISFWAIPIIIGCVFLASNTKSIVIIILATFPLWGLIGFVHLEYLKLNWGSVLKIDNVNEKLSYIDRKREVNIHYSNISKVVKYEPSDMAFLRDAYFYYEIFIEDQESIIVTCLMVRELRISGIKIERVTNPVPSIYLSEQKSK